MSDGDWLSPEQRRDHRIKLWRGACEIIKALSETNNAADDCGWRGDHRDVDDVASYIDGIDGSTLNEQIIEAANWISAERDNDIHGLRNRPVVREVLNHLRRKFHHG